MAHMVDMRLHMADMKLPGMVLLHMAMRRLKATRLHQPLKNTKLRQRLRVMVLPSITNSQKSKAA